MKPENELGVIVLFAQAATTGGFEFESISPAYPDAIIRKGGTQYRVEFEYAASSFYQHRHDPRKCDIIICWEDDYPESPLPVLALSEDGWQEKSLDLPSEVERECVYWKQKALLAEYRLRAIEAERERAAQEALKNGTPPPSFVCPSCGRSFGSQAALNGHGPLACADMKQKREEWKQ